MQNSLRQRRVEHARRLIVTADDTLLEHAGEVTDLRVLVVGTLTASLLCELTLTECRHVETTRPGCNVSTGRSDLVLVTDIPCGQTQAVVRQASAALGGRGRLIARLPRHDRHQARELRLALVTAGFRGIGEVFGPAVRFLSATL